MREFLNIDCMEYMATVPDKFFELAIVDPPYRNQEDNQPTQDMRNNGSIKKFGNKPDKNYFYELFRISRNQIIWGVNNFEIHSYKGFIIWKKITITEKFTMSMAEIAFISEELGTVSKVFEFMPQDKNRIHPTQKPVELYLWLLKNYAKTGDKIFDSHVGSASSLIACEELAFEYVGCELDKDYYRQAKERLEKYKNQKWLDF